MKTKYLQPAAFLDRDGTINVDSGYPDDPEAIVLIPGAIEAVKQLNQLGWRVIVVSNQSGIARGYFDAARVDLVNAAIVDRLAAGGATIDAFYICPHHPEAGEPPLRRICECRKPAPGLLLQASRDYPIDLPHSVMIGDKYSDIAAGKALGLSTILVETGQGRQQQARFQNDVDIPQPDYVAKDLLAAVGVVRSLRSL